MFLKALVTNSQFNEILHGLQKNELHGVTRYTDKAGFEDLLVVTAEATQDRLLQLARETCASIDVSSLVTLKEMDFLGLECHNELTDYGFESCQGMLTVWLPAGERL